MSLIAAFHRLATRVARRASRTRVQYLGAALVVAVTACASSSGGRSGVQQASRSKTDVITEDEIRSAHWQNLYELVQTLRPRWLRTHGPDSILGETAPVQVHLDDNRLGGVETLRNISASGVTSLRFIDPVTAAGRWGGDHANGAIIITTR
jgi:hypothetical protein